MPMNKFRFWLAIILALILGLAGFLLGDFLPHLNSYSLAKTKLFYASLGMIIGLLTYARIATWLVQTFTRLTTQAISRLAAEIINQFSHLTLRKPHPIIPFQSNIDLDSILEGNLEDFEGVMILDTSSIIDGRILDAARTGFISGLVLVPGFILQELQQVADSENPIKRARGRYGFEVISQLKRIKGLSLQIWDGRSDLLSKRAGNLIDNKLIYLGKILKGKILTCDFNLGKVAKLSGVDILNLNELANALKTLPLPGEQLSVKILHQGKDKEQGIGYLSDGVMVVVEDGASLIGTQVNIKATKILQSPTGRMVFGKRIK